MTTKKLSPKQRKAAKAVARGKMIGNLKRGFGGVVVRLLLERKHDPDAILKAAKRKFPKSKATRKHVMWYRNQLIHGGFAVAEVES